MNAPFPVRQLSDLATSIDYGVTASASTNDNGTKFLRITDIQDGAVDWQTVPFCEAAAAKLRSARLSDGDIVFARTGATTGKSFLIQSPPDGAVFASYLIRVRPSASVAPAYLAHFFQSTSYWSQIQRKTQGAAQGGVNATSLSEIKIPLPSLDEQRRIAAILDKADALRRKRKRAGGLLDAITQSIFLEMFGDPITNPKGFEISAFDSFLETPPNFGSMVPPKKERLEWLSLRVANIQNWMLTLNDSKYINLPAEAVERHTLRDGDIILARAIASEEHLGKCVVVRPAGKKWAFDSHLMRIRLDTTKIDPVYVRELFRTPGGRQIFLRSTRKTTVQYNINTKELRALRIPVPSPALQREFISRVEALHYIRDLDIHSSGELDRIFSSLQHRAFSGQL